MKSKKRKRISLEEELEDLTDQWVGHVEPHKYKPNSKADPDWATGKKKKRRKRQAGTSASLGGAWLSGEGGLEFGFGFRFFLIFDLLR